MDEEAAVQKTNTPVDIKDAPAPTSSPTVSLPDIESQEERDNVSEIDIRVEEVGEEDTSEGSDIEYDRVVEVLGLSRIEEVVEEEAEGDAKREIQSSEDGVVVLTAVAIAEAESVEMLFWQETPDAPIAAKTEQRKERAQTGKPIVAEEEDVASAGQSGSRRSSNSENYTLVEDVGVSSIDAGVGISKHTDKEVEAKGRVVEDELKGKGREVNVVVDEVTEDVDLEYVDKALAMVEAKSRIREIIEEKRTGTVEIHIGSSDLDHVTTALEPTPSSKSPVRKRKRLISAVFGRMLGKKSKTS